MPACVSRRITRSRRHVDHSVSRCRDEQGSSLIRIFQQNSVLAAFPLPEGCQAVWTTLLSFFLHKNSTRCRKKTEESDRVAILFWVRAAADFASSFECDLHCFEKLQLQQALVEDRSPCCRLHTLLQSSRTASAVAALFSLAARIRNHFVSLDCSVIRQRSAGGFCSGVREASESILHKATAGGALPSWFAIGNRALPLFFASRTSWTPPRVRLQNGSLVSLQKILHAKQIVRRTRDRAPSSLWTRLPFVLRQQGWRGDWCEQRPYPRRVCAEEPWTQLITAQLNKGERDDSAEEIHRCRTLFPALEIEPNQPEPRMRVASALLLPLPVECSCGVALAC